MDDCSLSCLYFSYERVRSLYASPKEGMSAVSGTVETKSKKNGVKNQKNS